MCGHLLRHNPFVANIFERRINGHKGRGRPRKAYLEEMTRQTGCNRYAVMKKLAIEKNSKLDLQRQDKAFSRIRRRKFM